MPIKIPDVSCAPGRRCLEKQGVELPSKAKALFLLHDAKATDKAKELMTTIKDAGVAGVISFALVQTTFWTARGNSAAPGTRLMLPSSEAWMNT